MQRSAQTREAKRTISQNDGTVVSPGGIKCHVGQMYMHVGTQITSTCNDTANVQYHLVKAKQGCGAQAKQCFASRELDVGTKVDVFRCLIMSILLRGAETWTRPSWARLCDVNTFVMASLRRITHEPRVPWPGKTQSVMKVFVSDYSFPASSV